MVEQYLSSAYEWVMEQRPETQGAMGGLALIAAVLAALHLQGRLKSIWRLATLPFRLVWATVQVPLFPWRAARIQRRLSDMHKAHDRIAVEIAGARETQRALAQSAMLAKDQRLEDGRTIEEAILQVSDLHAGNIPFEEGKGLPYRGTIKAHIDEIWQCYRRGDVPNMGAVHVALQEIDNRLQSIEGQSEAGEGEPVQQQILDLSDRVNGIDMAAAGAVRDLRDLRERAGDIEGAIADIRNRDEGYSIAREAKDLGKGAHAFCQRLQSQLKQLAADIQDARITDRLSFLEDERVSPAHAEPWKEGRGQTIAERFTKLGAEVSEAASNAAEALKVAHGAEALAQGAVARFETPWPPARMQAWTSMESALSIEDKFCELGNGLEAVERRLDAAGNGGLPAFAQGWKMGGAETIGDAIVDIRRNLRQIRKADSAGRKELIARIDAAAEMIHKPLGTSSIGQAILDLREAEKAHEERLKALELRNAFPLNVGKRPTNVLTGTTTGNVPPAELGRFNCAGEYRTVQDSRSIHPADGQVEKASEFKPSRLDMSRFIDQWMDDNPNYVVAGDGGLGACRKALEDSTFKGCNRVFFAEEYEKKRRERGEERETSEEETPEDAARHFFKEWTERNPGFVPPFTDFAKFMKDLPETSMPLPTLHAQLLKEHGVDVPVGDQSGKFKEPTEPKVGETYVPSDKSDWQGVNAKQAEMKPDGWKYTTVDEAQQRDEVRDWIRARLAGEPSIKAMSLKTAGEVFKECWSIYGTTGWLGRQDLKKVFDEVVDRMRIEEIDAQNEAQRKEAASAIKCWLEKFLHSGRAIGESSEAMHSACEAYCISVFKTKAPQEVFRSEFYKALQAATDEKDEQAKRDQDVIDQVKELERDEVAQEFSKELQGDVDRGIMESLKGAYQFFRGGKPVKVGEEAEWIGKAEAWFRNSIECSNPGEDFRHPNCVAWNCNGNPHFPEDVSRPTKEMMYNRVLSKVLKERRDNA